MMGRVRANITVNGQNYWTLFDSGAVNTYVTAVRATSLETSRLARPHRVRLGGTVHRVTHDAKLVAKIQGKVVDVRAYVVSRIGRDHEAKRDFDVIFGARAMQDWGIELDLKAEKLDMRGYPRKFVEFQQF